jgi:hypothetical protein
MWLVPKLKIKLGIENISGNFDSFLAHLPWQKVWYLLTKLAFENQHLDIHLIDFMFSFDITYSVY